jgi:capsular exopolysaccharide synthesis family protein
VELEEIRPGFSDHLKEAVGPRVQMLQENIANLTIERILTLERNPALRENENAEPRLREINRDIAAYREEIDQLVGRSLDGTTGFLIGEQGNVNQRVIELRRNIADQMIDMERMKALISRARAEIINYEQDLSRLPEDQTRLVRLERQRQLHERMYNDVAARQVELRLYEQSSTGNGRVFDYARLPSSPFYPDIPFMVVMGLFLGIGLSAGSVLLLVLTNKKIDSIDVMKSYELPLMSVIPEIRTMIRKEFKGNEFYDTGEDKVATSLTTFFDPVSSVSEAYRRLYNNIRFNNPDVRHKMLVVTSPGKFEGKSTCTANLAISMCGSGRSVVLVDCDFRRPMQHTLFGKDKRPGVIDHLFSGRKIDDVITHTVVEGLDLIPAGVEPSSPGLAANSDKMRELLNTLSERYDYVIIDTPPYGIINDAAPLIKQADGVLALARFKRTTTTELDQLLEGLKAIRAGVVGTVLMDFNPREASGYYAENKLYSYHSKVYESYQSAERKKKKTVMGLF